MSIRKLPKLCRPVDVQVVDYLMILFSCIASVCGNTNIIYETKYILHFSECYIKQARYVIYFMVHTPKLIAYYCT